jgi:hypothetical protein
MALGPVMLGLDGWELTASEREILVDGGMLPSVMKNFGAPALEHSA